jgi:hypothetical protein
MRRVTPDFAYSLGRGGIAVAACALVAQRLLARRGGRADRFARARVAALCVLAVLSWSSYYYFFRLYLPGGFHTRDTFHYYLGAKYFPELGYFGLYDCSLAALVEDGLQDPDALPYVRNLRTLLVQPPRVALARGRHCEQTFGPTRWAEFKRDVRWLRARMPDRVWRELMTDHGYNPTPVWTLFGRALTAWIPTDSPAMHALMRSDRVMVTATFLALAWAFGLETGALAVIVWGTGYSWRYGWVGDSLLRYLWLCTALLGIALLRHRRQASAGVLLATSALVRVFPAVFAGGALLAEARRAWEGRRLDAELLRLVAGAAVATLLLVPLSIVVAGTGLAAYADFFAKIATFAQTGAINKVGLAVALHAWIGSAAAVAALRIVAIVAFAALYWRALRHAETWEAAALAFAWIPLVTDPTNYYYSFVVAGALLAERRPAAGLAVLAASVAWTANGLLFYLSDDAYRGESLIAVALSFAVVWIAGRPASGSTVASGVAPGREAAAAVAR